MATPENDDPGVGAPPIVHTRAYQQELLEESLHRNLIIALDTGSGKTHIAVLRMKLEAERHSRKVSWFIAPTVALVDQQYEVIKTAIPVSVGHVSGASEPNQWKDASLWRRILATHRIMVTTPQVLLDALHHAYVDLGTDIGLMVFDEAHHATGKHPYSMIMKNFYMNLPSRTNLTGPTDRVRPAVLGLTASPIYGGNVDVAFRDLEKNLDSTIRSARKHRDNLAEHVYRPEFKHVLYASPIHVWDGLPSANYQSLQTVIDALDIENDPYVKSLRSRLAKLRPTDDRHRLDQQLSKAIDKEDTFTHKGLRDFARAAAEICVELGPWAADWYVAKVIERAKVAANPYNNIMSAWQEKEKRYLLSIISKVNVTTPPSDVDKIVSGVSPKVRALVDSLVVEEGLFRSRDEDYSGLIFVTRRDTVLALAELLQRIPETAQLFRIGCLLGSSSSFKRHSFLDITRNILDESQADTLRDFKIGDKNLIVSTSVAEEGIDIQACGSVIRFDPPPNIVAWAQSRGRARRKRSSFIIMFEETGPQKVKEWEATERQMMLAYNDPRRDAIVPVDEDDAFDDMDGYVEFEVASTGALLTLHSAIPHLNHFCAVIPSGGHESHVPIYELDPPDYVEGWHSLPNPSRMPYQGPWGATVSLPRALPKHLRKFSTPQIHGSKRRAQQHVAYQAYLELYHAGLLDNHLLPLSTAIEPDKKEEVEAMLAEVAKRAGTARVAIQMDPWSVYEDVSEWFAHEVTVEGLPGLRMLTRRPLPAFNQEDFPTLYIPKLGEATVFISSAKAAPVHEEEIQRARQYTYRLFNMLYGSRMDRDMMDFAYLFLPATSWPDEGTWEERRRWQTERYSKGLTAQGESPFVANAAAFGERFSYPKDLAIVRGMNKFDKHLQLLRWRNEPLSAEEEESFREQYAMYPDLQISYPLMVVQSLPRRRNFLIPLTLENADRRIQPPPDDSLFLLHPQYALVELASRDEVQYALMLPSILRWLANALTVDALRTNLFRTTSVAGVPLPLLLTAITAPIAQELSHYQRLETLGDTVLKFTSSNQLYAEFPLWHEGYLSRKKDHAVANSSLAKEAVKKGLYQWIIRDRFVPRKWKPHCASSTQGPLDELVEEKEEVKEVDAKVGKDGKPKKKKAEELSTKMLADVVESLIGAAYEHGGFDLAIDCVARFGLGISWKKLSERIKEMHEVEDLVDLPDQLALVEQMLNYQFKRRTFLVQALTHASYQGDSAVMSLERLEFLGDSALDMVVTDYLYHAEGKNYSPGYMHIKKEAAVNSHILAYVCLSTSVTVESVMPTWTLGGGLATTDDSQKVHLWQCLLHSSHRVLEDQNLTFARFEKHGPAIAQALREDRIYPWAALTSLQAPKFISDMVESILGAVYVDSMGSLDAVRGVMRSLGLMQVIERVVIEDVDVLHPVSRLAIWAAKQDPQKKVEYKIEREKGQVKCAVLMDEEELLHVTASYRSRVSEDEVRFTAAERAIKKLQVMGVEVDIEEPIPADDEEVPEKD
ncbi:P-loop containing nucleoside triphosphate hydrolase protein [Trametes versicolor FP-101664 SS1]|uniref:P-loop containing nucleoside triphosphate hydrolase protein n=1 Tax=Trametes versicolor (strain FP-101664) TaxID=717944 RepID=UPI0004621785|nr:P-loop containing nucleoside triphosphate hydrolase protein [Trametes versicolor FP-101664 SS1]EIW59400.1 P-loop containing nucleoside triphosphate hydrolase protein [Trametes versicolor FP-101664 SS1]